MRRIDASLALVAALCGGCASIVRPTTPTRPPASAVVIDPAETASCLRPSAGRGGSGYALLEPPVDDPAVLAELAAVPAEVRRTARAAGLEAVLAGLLRAEASAPDERSLEVLAMRLQVVTRISALEIELTSLLFEADCTGDQLEAVLVELDRREGKRELVLTVASIAVGALLGAGAGIWELRGDSQAGPPVLGIAAGAGTAVLGIAALVPIRGRVIYEHERNLFAPIVAGEDPDRLYPPFVFRLLTTPRFAGGATPRELLLRDWQRTIGEAVRAGDRRAAEAVLYGRGGVYDGELVDVRERMFDALEAQLNAFDQDLELLYQYTSRLLADAPTR